MLFYSNTIIILLLYKNIGTCAYYLSQGHSQGVPWGPGLPSRDFVDEIFFFGI